MKINPTILDKIELYNIKKSQTELSKKLGLSIKKLQKILKENNINSKKSLQGHDFISRKELERILNRKIDKGFLRKCYKEGFLKKYGIDTSLTKCTFHIDNIEILRDLFENYISVSEYCKSVYITKSGAMKRLKTGKVNYKRIGVTYFIHKSEIKR